MGKYLWSLIANVFFENERLFKVMPQKAVTYTINVVVSKK